MASAGRHYHVSYDVTRVFVCCRRVDVGDELAGPHPRAPHDGTAAETFLPQVDSGESVSSEDFVV